jgi:hypothetical protein
MRGEQAWKLARTVGVAAAMAAMGVLTGCVGYASFPYEEGGKNALATQDPNTPPADELMALSLDWVVSKYPPRGSGVSAGAGAGAGAATDPSFTINIPKGVRRDVYDKILDKLGGRAAPGVRRRWMCCGRCWKARAGRGARCCTRP